MPGSAPSRRHLGGRERAVRVERPLRPQRLRVREQPFQKRHDSGIRRVLGMRVHQIFRDGGVFWNKRMGLLKPGDGPRAVLQ